MHPFTPDCAHPARVLILGTWPSPKSRETGFYYGHPRNRFWPMLARLYGAEPPRTREEKEELIRTHGLALWDVLASCEITGAADASIRAETPNDIPALCRELGVQHVLCNGATAYTLYQKHIPNGPAAEKLPSTSPANAAKSMDALCDAWGDALRRCGVL